jgi:hypothetical protein
MHCVRPAKLQGLAGVQLHVGDALYLCMAARLVSLPSQGAYAAASGGCTGSSCRSNLTELVWLSNWQ